MKKISVLIPHFNDKINLKSLINSFAANNIDQVLEIIIVDDGSVNPPVKEDFPSDLPIVLIPNYKNKGTGFTRNKLLQSARGSLLLFIDSDCVLLGGNFFNQLITYADSADILYPSVSFPDGKMMHPRNLFEESHPRMSTCFCIKKSSLLTSQIEFAQFLKFFYEDECFFIRAERAKMNSRYLPDLKVQHVQSITGQGERPLRFKDWTSLYFGSFVLSFLYSKREFTAENLKPEQLKMAFVHGVKWKACRERLWGLGYGFLLFMLHLPHLVMRKALHKIP